MALADVLERTLENYGRIWLMCTEITTGQQAGQQPTQAAIDAIVAAAGSAGVMRPRITTTVDGENYNWTEYQQALGQLMKDVREQIILAQDPYEYYARPYT